MAQAFTLPQHIAALDGLRAAAALGVVVTHVSFQTRTGWAFAERFDFFVAVFFALSAFVLWRRPVGDIPSYYRRRALRLAPAYLATVIAVTALLPEARSMTWPVIAANLTATQIYFPNALAPGLTHLWSLCVEIAFYIAMPVIAWGLRRFSKPVRVGIIIAIALASLGWGWLAEVIPGTIAPADVNAQIWPPAYSLWFAVGMLAAEAEGHVPAFVARVLRIRWIWWVAAGLLLWLASRSWYGPLGLTHPEPEEFFRRVVAGGAFAACVVVPYALAPPTGAEAAEATRAPSIFETRAAQALGRWSYSIFLWHVAVLALVFPILGIPLFSGNITHFWVVLAATVAATIPISAASYELIEQRAHRPRAQRGHQQGIPGVVGAGPRRARQHSPGGHDQPRD